MRRGCERSERRRAECAPKGRGKKKKKLLCTHRGGEGQRERERHRRNAKHRNKEGAEKRNKSGVQSQSEQRRLCKVPEKERETNSSKEVKEETIVATTRKEEEV